MKFSNSDILNNGIKKNNSCIKIFTVIQEQSNIYCRLCKFLTLGYRVNEESNQIELDTLEHYHNDTKLNLLKQIKRLI